MNAGSFCWTVAVSAFFFCDLGKAASWPPVPGMGQYQQVEPVDNFTAADFMPVDDEPVDPFVCWHLGENNAQMHERFQKFFENEDIDAFKQQYLEKLSNRTTDKVLGYMLDSNDNSLAVTLNTALDTYAISTRAEINRAFQTFKGSWNHYPLREFFQDFTENSSFPLLSNSKDLKNEDTRFQLWFDEVGVTIDAPAKMVVQNGLKSSDALTVRKIIRKIVKEEGDSALFYTKAHLLKALWNPKPDLRDLLEAAWCTASHASNGNYMAFYIPYQEKIDGIRIAQHYLNTTHNYCDQEPINCPQNIVVIHENDQIFRSIKYWSGYKVMEMKDLIFNSEFDVEEYTAPISENLLENFKPSYKKRDLWVKRNREMMLSITIMAMADRVFCPEKSAVCQAVALLHGLGSPDFIENIDFHNMYSH